MIDVKLKTFPYTMTFSQPKTGTTTVMRAVASAGIPCHRCHEGNVEEYHLRDMPTITQVREPIGRYVSEVWERYLNSGKSDNLDPFHLSIEDAMAGIKKSLGWFDAHYRQTTGINIYGDTILKKKGWHIYSIRGLVIRTDVLSEQLEKALLEFLPPYFPDANYASLTVEHRAIGEERFGENYLAFKDSIKFPKTFLEEVYGHKLCKHFFYMKDLKELLSYWKE